MRKKIFEILSQTFPKCRSMPHVPLHRVLVTIDNDQGAHFTSHHIAEFWNKVFSEFSSHLLNGFLTHKVPLWL